MASQNMDLLMSALASTDNIKDVGQLRSLLEHVQMRVNKTQQTEDTNTKVTVQSLFLDILPLELRIKVYESALVNPFLSDPEAIHPYRSQFGATIHYNLSPALLRTCKQVYNEASTVLYGKNTFVVSGLGNTRDDLQWPKLVECPLSRYLHVGPLQSRLLNFAKTPSLRKVRNWKLVVSAYAYNERPHLATRDFVRLIVDSPPLLSLTVLVMSQTMFEHWNRSSVAHPGPSSVSYQLEPIKMLRNVQAVHFEDPAGVALSSALQSDLKAAATGNSTAHHVFKMYSRLVRYAQAFERAKDTQYRMKVPRWVGRSEFESHFGTPRWQSAMNANLRPGINLNVFTAAITHPVEAALKLAKFASDENDFDTFRDQRKIVLEFLEPQYQRIAAASDLWTSFVKEHKRQSGTLGAKSEGLFRAPGSGHIKVIVEATALLERYADAFTRDLTPEIELVIRFHRRQFQKSYKCFERENALSTMDKALERRDWPLWETSFRTAAKDMDSQYLGIRHLRKRLFVWDNVDTDRGCELDLEEWRFDEEIVWDVDEPEMGPFQQ